MYNLCCILSLNGNRLVIIMIVNRKHLFSQYLLIAYKVLGSREVVTKIGYGDLWCFYVLGRDKQSNSPDFYVKMLAVLSGTSSVHALQVCKECLNYSGRSKIKEDFPEDRTGCRPSAK